MDKIEAIKAFTAKREDYIRHDLSKPWVHEDKIRASNGHILIELPAALLESHPFVPYQVDNSVPNGLPAPDFNKVIPKPVELKDFAPSLLTDVLDNSHIEPKTRVVPPTDPCEECDGKGEYEDEDTGRDIACTFCDGKGQVPCPNAGEVELIITPTPLLGRNYNWHYLKIIKDAMDVFGGAWQIALGQKSPCGFSTETTAFYSSHGVIIAIMECRV